MKRLALVAVAAAAVGTCAGPADAAERRAVHAIGVRAVAGDGELFVRRTGAPFVPRGSTYLRRAWRDMGGGVVISHQATFDVGGYDAASAETALATMAMHGHNTVKVFVDVACVGTCLGERTTQLLSFEYVGNVVDFVRRAKRHRLQVVIAVDEPPWGTWWNARVGAPFDGFNQWFLTEAGADGFSRFWRDFISALIVLGAPVDSILAYELGGETWFQPDRAPLSRSSGTFVAANGRAYDLGSAPDREALLADGLAHFVSRVRTAIRSVDPTALVTMGVIAPTVPHAWRPGDTRLAVPLAVLERTALDFIDVHAYPGWDLPLPQYIENFGLRAPSPKPIVVGEIGAYQFAFPTVHAAARGLQTWQAASCAYGFDGWLLWTWDTPTPVWPQMWHATAEGAHLARELGTRARPDPCAAPATLSPPAP